jgi:hypothetical protein
MGTCPSPSLCSHIPTRLKLNSARALKRINDTRSINLTERGGDDYWVNPNHYGHSCGGISKSVVKQRFDFNTRLFGTKFSPAQTKYGEVVGFIIGAAFIVFGILTILGLVKFS